MVRLSESTQKAIRTAELLTARDEALRDLVGMIDPHSRLSTNGRAALVAELLNRDWPRSPRNAFEAALCAVIDAPGPKSARKLFDVLVELRL